MKECARLLRLCDEPAPAICDRCGSGPCIYSRAYKEPVMAACSNTLRREGKPSPRTCEHCGLGPCSFKHPCGSPDPEDTFAAPPLPTAGETLPTSLPATVPVPGHGARPDVPPAQARLARLEASCDRFVDECRAIGGRDAQIAITNAEQAMLWARRALKVA